MSFRDDSGDRLDRLEKQGRMAKTPIGQFQVTLNSTTLGTAVSFQVLKAQGIQVFRLLRNFSKDVGSAKPVHEWSAAGLEGSTVKFSDDDPAIRGKAVSYWVWCVPALLKASSPKIGPQTITVNADTGPPLVIADFDASHEAGAGNQVLVTCNFKPPTDDRFGSCKIYVAGYNGVAASVAIAQSATNPIQFTLSQTGETVTFTAISVNKSGAAEQTTGPTKSLALTQPATVSAKPMNCTALETTSAVQINFPASAEASITQYTIFRGARGAGFGAAASIGTTLVSAGTSRYTFTDSSGLTGKFEWYVVANCPAGNSANSDAFYQAVSNSSADNSDNPPSNNTNNATLDSIDLTPAGPGHTCEIRVYGPGGVGSQWTRYTGYGTELYNQFLLVGKSFSTTYYVAYDKPNGVLVADASYANVLKDTYIFIGKLTTVASGGGGGTGGGGTGGGGIGGCVEVGTPAEYRPGSHILERTVPNEDWIAVLVPSEPDPIYMHPETLVPVFKSAKDLQSGDRWELDANSDWEEITSAIPVTKRSFKVERISTPSRDYFVGYGKRKKRLHNAKPI